MFYGILMEITSKLQRISTRNRSKRVSTHGWLAMGVAKSDIVEIKLRKIRFCFYVYKIKYDGTPRDYIFRPKKEAWYSRNCYSY